MQAVKLDSLSTSINSTLKLPAYGDSSCRCYPQSAVFLYRGEKPNTLFLCHFAVLLWLRAPGGADSVMAADCMMPWTLPPLYSWQRNRICVASLTGHFSPCVGPCGKDASELGYPPNCCRESFLGSIFALILKDQGSVTSGSYLLCS